MATRWNILHLSAQLVILTLKNVHSYAPWIANSQLKLKSSYSDDFTMTFGTYDVGLRRLMQVFSLSDAEVKELWREFYAAKTGIVEDTPQPPLPPDPLPPPPEPLEPPSPLPDEPATLSPPTTSPPLPFDPPGTSVPEPTPSLRQSTLSPSEFTSTFSIPQAPTAPPPPPPESEDIPPPPPDSSAPQSISDLISRKDPPQAEDTSEPEGPEVQSPPFSFDGLSNEEPDEEETSFFNLNPPGTDPEQEPTDTQDPEATSPEATSSEPFPNVPLPAPPTGGGGAKWPAWPSPTGSVQMGDKIKVGAGEVFDGGMKSYKGGQFRVSGGGTLQNIIIEDPSEDISVHCSKGCILKNVWWPNLGDFKAAEFQRVDGEQNSQKFLVEGGGVEGTANRRAFVFNAVGQLTFRNFQLINWTRGILCNQGGASCKGNNICRSMVFENVRATGNRDGGWFTLYNNAKIDSATNLVFDKADEGEFAICRDDTSGARAKDAADAGSCGINPGEVSFV